MDDAPSVVEFFDDQGVPSADRLFGQSQFPLPGDKGDTGRQDRHQDVAKGELAHLLSLGLVSLFVAFERWLPAHAGGMAFTFWFFRVLRG